MKLVDHVGGVFVDAAAMRVESAMLHACAALDGTAKKLFPSEISSARRFKRCMRDYVWLIEPMMGVGFNLVDTRFENVTLPKVKGPPDFADVVYHVHRCAHAHGEEVAPGFSIIPSQSAFVSQWVMGRDELQMPDKIIWALTAVAVFCHVNQRNRGQLPEWQLAWGNEVFPLAAWWGREDDIRLRAAAWNTHRVQLNGLDKMTKADPTTEQPASFIVVAPPPS